MEDKENLNETDQELDALLLETVTGLRKRINSDDSNASDYQAATKLLAMTGRLDGVREAAEQRVTAKRMEGFTGQFDSLPGFDSDGVEYADPRQTISTQGQTRQ